MAVPKEPPPKTTTLLVLDKGLRLRSRRVWNRLLQRMRASHEARILLRWAGGYENPEAGGIAAAAEAAEAEAEVADWEVAGWLPRLCRES